MNKKLTVLVDLDGTANLFDEHFAVWVHNMGYGFDWDSFTSWSIEKAISGVDSHKEQKKIFAHVLNQPEFWMGIPVMAHAQETIAALKDDGRYDLKICTNPWGDDSRFRQVKLDWLANHFPHFDVKDVIFSGKEKWLIDGDVIIDDKPEVLEMCWGKKWTIRSVRPYNTNVKANYAFLLWPQVPEFLDDIHKEY